MDKNRDKDILGIKREHRIINPIPVVRLIVLDERKKVLILKRADTSYGEGHWCLPGGKIDYCEKVFEAAEKELKEETSLECVSLEFLFYQDSLPEKYGEMHCINFYFECQTAGNIILNKESNEYAWIDRKTISDYELVFRNKEGLLKFWEEAW